MISKYEALLIENLYLIYDDLLLRDRRRELVLCNIFEGDTLYLVAAEKFWKVGRRGIIADRRANRKAEKRAKKVRAAEMGALEAESVKKNHVKLANANDKAKTDEGDGHTDDMSAMMIVKQEVQDIRFMEEDLPKLSVVKEGIKDEYHEAPDLRLVASSKESIGVGRRYNIDDSKENIKVKEEVELEMLLA